MKHVKIKNILLTVIVSFLFQIFSSEDEQLEQILKANTTIGTIVIGNSGIHRVRPQFELELLNEIMQTNKEQLDHLDSVTMDHSKSIIPEKLHVVGNVVNLQKCLISQVTHIALELLPSVAIPSPSDKMPNFVMTNAVITASNILTEGAKLTIQHAPFVSILHMNVPDDIFHSHHRPEHIMIIIDTLTKKTAKKLSRENILAYQKTVEILFDEIKDQNSTAVWQLKEIFATFFFQHGVNVSFSKDALDIFMAYCLFSVIHQKTDESLLKKQIIEPLQSFMPEIFQNEDFAKEHLDALKSVGYVYFVNLWYFSKIERAVEFLRKLGFIDIEHTILDKPSHLNGRRNVIEITAKKASPIISKAHM